ncbi:MAG: acyl-CoA thioesterase [Acidimicrobiaceae bacterium]|nr:acyl-CoA thioesterase [Acidimicrobiaceae bacterium]
MSHGIAALLELLDLETIEVNLFRGRSPEGRVQRVFGGQVAAQSLIAAGRTVEAGLVHSLHSYFLRPGDPTVPILYEVDRIRDGRTFTTRRVVAIQHGKAIFNLHCSFQRPEEGLEHQDPVPDAPRPSELAGPPEPSAGVDLPVHFRLPNGLEIRFVTVPPWERADETVPGTREQLWLRYEDELPDDPLVHAAVATYASDLTLVDTVLQRHGTNPWGDEFVGASLDHCMWFHRPFRSDHWLLYDQHSPTAHGARGFALGTLFSENGDLVASVAQEGLVRFRRPA